MLTVETSHSKVVSSSPAVGKNFSFFMLSKTLRIDQNTCSRGGGRFGVLDLCTLRVYIILLHVFISDLGYYSGGRFLSGLSQTE